MQLIYPTEQVRDFAKRHGSADAAWKATFGPNDRDSLDWSSQVLWLAQIERGTHENLDFLADHEATSEGYYAQAEWHFDDRFSLLLRYGELYADRNDRSGRALEMASGGFIPGHVGYSHIATLGARWDLSAQLMLQAEVQRTNITQTAERLDVSRTAVSLLLSGKYTADPTAMHRRILDVLGSVACPYLEADISHAACRRWHSRQRPPAQTATDVRHWRACQRCHQNPATREEQ